MRMGEALARCPQVLSLNSNVSIPRLMSVRCSNNVKKPIRATDAANTRAAKTLAGVRRPLTSNSRARPPIAAQAAVTDAGKTIKNIKSIYVKNMEGVVKDGKIRQFRLNANITFEVE